MVVTLTVLALYTEHYGQPSEFTINQAVAYKERSIVTASLEDIRRDVESHHNNVWFEKAMHGALASQWASLSFGSPRGVGVSRTGTMERATQLRSATDVQYH